MATYLDEAHDVHGALQLNVRANQAGHLTLSYHVPILLGVIIEAVGDAQQPRARLDAQTLVPVLEPALGVYVELVLRQHSAGQKVRYT